MPDQENLSPPNQKPICIDENNHLIYGLETINACKKQGKKSVFGWRLSLSALLNGKYDVDDLVQTFDLLERTAIEIALKRYIREHRDIDKVGNLPTLNGMKTRDITSKLVGFSSSRTSRRLEKILQSNCSIDLIYQLRHNKITVSKAASLADLPPTKQAIHLSKPY